MSSTLKQVLLVAGACSVCATAGAQPPAAGPPPEDRVFFLQNVAPLPVFGGRIEVLGGGGGIAGPVVKDKPYSARSITESTQVLADGNRIVQRNESTIHRDSEGRTRREQKLGGVGPWATGEPATIIDIHDPVANKTYMLDPVERIAREIRPFRMAIADAEGVETARTTLEAGPTQMRRVFSAAVPAPVPGGGIVTATRGVTVEQGVTVGVRGGVAAGTVAFAPSLSATMDPYAPAEELGEQVLEGLLVQGTRMKDTIPAGVMGNERPIEIVTERWYSKDIDAMVLQRFADPRFGETVYQLVNVVRGDPSPDLFQVPQGYELRSADEALPAAGVRTMPGQRFEFQLRGEPGAPPPPP
jgi:hypothetical protein